MQTRKVIKLQITSILIQITHAEKHINWHIYVRNIYSLGAGIIRNIKENFFKYFEASGVWW